LDSSSDPQSHPCCKDGFVALGSLLVVYRLFRERDFAALYALEEACFELSFRFSRGYLRKLVVSTKTATWIAENEDGVAGFAIVEFQDDREQKIAYVVTIEVDRKQRGGGIGSELLYRIEGSAQAAGAILVWLHVDAENTAAIRLYEAHGYACRGKQENFYPQGRPALIYVKPFQAMPASIPVPN
jgi:ribosomal protein S18 acetylase RimI-like enzyme